MDMRVYYILDASRVWDIVRNIPSEDWVTRIHAINVLFKNNNESNV